MRGRTIARGAIVVVALTFLAAALLSLGQYVAVLPLIDAAAKVERSGNRLPTASRILQSRLAGILDGEDACREPIRRSRVTSALFLYRLASEAVPGGTRARERLARAQEITVDALRCGPLDGFLWLIAADLGRASLVEAARLRGFLAQSISVTPFEGPVLDARAAWLVQFGAAFRIGEDPVLRADLANQLRYGRLPAAVQTIDSLGAAGFGEMADELVAGLDEGRRLSLGNERRAAKLRAERALSRSPQPAPVQPRQGAP